MLSLTWQFLTELHPDAGWIRPVAMDSTLEQDLGLDGLLQALGPASFAWLAAGGVFYTFGIVFFALDTRLAHAHGVWHLIVLAGSACHHVAILRYVL